MELIYVISSPGMMAINKYKIGKHSGTQNKLLSRYKTYITDVVILFSYPTRFSTVLEKKILAHFDDKRVSDANGIKSEWIIEDLKKIILTILTIVNMSPELRTPDSFDSGVVHQIAIDQMPQKTSPESLKILKEKKIQERAEEIKMRLIKAKANLEEVKSRCESGKKESKVNLKQESKIEVLFVYPLELRIPDWFLSTAGEFGIISESLYNLYSIGFTDTYPDIRTIFLYFPDSMEKAVYEFENLSNFYHFISVRNIDIYFIFESRDTPNIFYEKFRKFENFFQIINDYVVGSTEFGINKPVFDKFYQKTKDSRFSKEEEFKKFNTLIKD